ncbi:MAG: hypothetical protein HQ567_25825 [Candidatus Nealsonbacteria bacterium]|nr:hypothetical protein [Candidatus Nealsonbacteria bacterium]
MTEQHDDPRAGLRRNVYTLLIVLGTGVMLGRILAVDAVDQIGLEEYRIRLNLAEKEANYIADGIQGADLKWKMERQEKRLQREMALRRPFLSANDRSRWCTVRALVDPEMRVDGHPYAIDRVIEQRTWDTIDMVKHDDEGRGGMGPREGHLYSSKPPLYPTMLAGEYWLINWATGMTLDEDPHVVARIMLVSVNLIPLIVCFLLLAKLVERFGTSDWGRIFVMGAAVFGTFLTTFAVTINNHLPAAVSVMIAVYAAVRICFDGDRRWRYFILAGLFGAFAAANELPALSFLGLLSLVLLLKSPLRTIFVYVPAVMIVAAGFFSTNWVAHGDFKPPYLHRNDADPNDINEDAPNDNWYDYKYVCNGKEIESYWNNPTKLDRGEPSWGIYAAHVLVGHHGIFSLTPVWLLSLAGGLIWLGRGADSRLRYLTLLIGVISAVVLAFYLLRPEHHRNYGGVTSGLRWMFWLAPLWLLTMLPAADAMARRCWTRLVAAGLLILSVLAASYPTWSPWTSPWIEQYWGW